VNSIAVASTAAEVTYARRQPWLYGSRFDLGLILGPPIFASLVAIWLAPTLEHRDMPPLAWLLLVVFVDVAHVYSTIFRTCFSKEQRERWRQHLILIPVLSWLVGVMLYSLSDMTFWRVLAYLAVFHFVRQQYGFVRLYGREEGALHPVWYRRLDAAAIYAAAGYPILHWHTSSPKSFQWFVAGDFVTGPLPWVDRIGFVIYGTILVLYACKELLQLFRTQHFNLPKNLVILGTALAWYVGIVLYDGDWTFTLTNVLSHGIPYMALIWTMNRKVLLGPSAPARPVGATRLARGVAIFVVSLLVLAYCEEWLWDALVWRENATIFPWLASLRELPTRSFFPWIVSLLAVPQVTHYIIDGFIWRGREAS